MGAHLCQVYAMPYCTEEGANRKQNMMVYISICSLIGGLSVVCTTGKENVRISATMLTTV